ncbi:hypothetical protein SOR_1256 [Streptococcus oralis Uo5]|uniref:Uncharacterized protein n=1 Tax=Streptococcus oralis (strain Uo5) TaxID=927666 RepID=F2QE45_STROU|nr:hypothetical protein [Streptococcus oralis]CBZ00914.1 hypothetical protein SOR_1256 [Streptococcus oralis Uo5]
MLEYKKHQLIENGEIIKSFTFEIRNIIELVDGCIVLLEVPFDNDIEKNNILRVDGSGNIVWTIDNSGYSNNIYPFEQMTLSDGWLYATDFYGRRLKVDIKTGKIVDMTLSK